MNRVAVFIMALLFAGISVYGQRTTQPGVRISGTHTPGNLVVFGASGRTLEDSGVGPTNVVYGTNVTDRIAKNEAWIAANSSGVAITLNKGTWFDGSGSLIARMSSFSTNSADWVTDSDDAANLAITNGVQMFHYGNGSLSFNGSAATITATNAGISSLYMYVDAVPFRGKRINVNIEGVPGTNATLSAQGWQYIDGSIDVDLYYERLPVVSAGASGFAKQFQYSISPDADVFIIGVEQSLAIGDSFSITRLDASTVEGWEEQAIIGADRLKKTKAWVDALSEGTITKFDVTLIGDSWTCNNRVEQRLYESFARVARMDEVGFVGFQDHGGGGGFHDSSFGSIEKTAGWENIHDQPSLDQSGIISTNVGDIITNTALPRAGGGNILHTHPIVYYDGTKVGSFRWRADQDTDGVGDGPWIQRADWTTVTNNGAGDKWASFTQGFTSYYAKRITIETLSGTNLFYGCNWNRVDGQPQTYDGGYVFHKGGKSGGYMYDWADVSTGSNASFQREAFSDAGIDLMILFLATNDQYNYRSGPSQPKYFYKDLMNYLDNLRAAVGDDVDILLVVPPMNAERENSGPMYAYRNAMHLVAQKYDCAFINMIPVFGNDPEEYKYGTDKGYLDSSDSHPSADGLDLMQDAIDRALGLDRLPALSNLDAPIEVVATGDYQLGTNDWREAWGATIFMNASADAVVTFPWTEENGMHFDVVNLTANSLSVHETTWHSPIILNGVTLDAGDRITTTNIGAVVSMTFVEGTGWIAVDDNTWIDGGP